MRYIIADTDKVASFGIALAGRKSSPDKMKIVIDERELNSVSQIAGMSTEETVDMLNGRVFGNLTTTLRFIKTNKYRNYE